MQRVVYSPFHVNVHPIFSDIEQYYTTVSVKEAHSSMLLLRLPLYFDSSFIWVSELFEKYGGVKYPFIYVDKHYEKLELPTYDDKNVIVCASGGKDSLATVLKYKALGYNVHMYHVKGLNRSYHGETEAVIKLANKLDLPLYIEEISYSGNHDYLEHPMKNMILANMALNYGISHNISTNIVIGDFSDMHIDTVAFDKDAGDTVEMWDAYNKLIQQIIPGFEIKLMGSNMWETFEILSEYPEYLEDTISCLGAFRYRTYLHDKNSKKYGVNLLKNRCGSCWKCAIEYIYFVDHDIFEYNEDYYKHCLKVLQKKLREDTQVVIKSASELWNCVFKYPITESKLQNIKSLRL